MKHMNNHYGVSKILCGLNLQLFAEGDPADDPEPGDDPEGDPVDDPEDDPKDDPDPEFTPEQQEKINAIVRGVKKELKDKFEKERAAAVNKAARLATLSEEERKAEEEADRIAALDKREKEIQYKEYKLEAVGQLKEHNLTADFADMVLAEEPEQTVENIKALRTIIDAEVEAEVKKRLAGKPPASGTQTPSASTGEQIAKARNEEKKPQGLDPWK